MVALLLALGSPTSASALEARVSELRATSSSSFSSSLPGDVRAAIELKGAFAPAFRTLVDNEGVLYLRIEAGLWEDRLWDRLVRPATLAVFRIRRNPSTREVTVADALGGFATYQTYPDPLAVRVDVAPARELHAARRYYLHVVATLGTIAEREINDMGEAVFGSERGSSGLANLGRFIFRKALEISDYLQSASAETTSRKFSGQEIVGNESRTK